MVQSSHLDYQPKSNSTAESPGSKTQNPEPAQMAYAIYVVKALKRELKSMLRMRGLCTFAQTKVICSGGGIRSWVSNTARVEKFPTYSL